MGQKILIAVVTAAVSSFASAAIAADAVLYEPAPVPQPQYVQDFAPFNWSGAYVGLQGGYAWTALTTPGGSEADYDGGSLGVHLGYTMQNGNLVYGVEGDINYNWNETTHSVPGVGSAETGLDWDGSIRGRLGYALDRNLLYGTAGVAFGNAYLETPFSDASETFIGWTIGAGAERAFTDHISARIEYRYTDFGSQDFGLNLGDFDIKQHAVKAGLSYRF